MFRSRMVSLASSKPWASQSRSPVRTFGPAQARPVQAMAASSGFRPSLRTGAGLVGGGSLQTDEVTGSPFTKASGLDAGTGGATPGDDSGHLRPPTNPIANEAASTAGQPSPRGTRGGAAPGAPTGGRNKRGGVRRRGGGGGRRG